MEKFLGRVKETLFMLAVKRLPLGPLHVCPLGQSKRPSPTVKKRFSSISVGTSTLDGLLSEVVNALAAPVSLKAGRDGKMGFNGCFAGHGADLYSRMAVVVVLSKDAF